MLAVYGVDVLDPRVTLRRLSSLVHRLPAGSWPDEKAAMSWSVEAHLLAGVMDSLAALTFVTVKAYGGKPPKPKPFPRPRGATHDSRFTNREPPKPRIPWSALVAELRKQPGVEVVTHG
jgi:hypothetical protein